MNIEVNALKGEVMALVDEKSINFSRDDYREFLDWLGSEAACRTMAMDDEELEDDG